MVLVAVGFCSLGLLGRRWSSNYGQCYLLPELGRKKCSKNVRREMRNILREKEI